MGAPVRHTEPGHDARRRGPRPLLLRVPGRLLRRLLQIPAARPPHTRTWPHPSSLRRSIFTFIPSFHTFSCESQEGAAFLDSLELDAIIQSRLNPLRLCASTVVTEFLKVAADLCGLLPSARAVLERNKRVVLATKSVFGNANQLDSFFPFDPYLLRHSSKHISAIYQTWSPIPENPATATTAPPTTTTASTASTIARPSSSAAAPPSPAMRVPLTFLSSLPGSSSPNLGDGYGSSNETPPGTPNFLMRRGSIGGEELAASFTGSPGGFSSMLSMTPESVSNDVDFSWKYSWGGK